MFQHFGCRAVPVPAACAILVLAALAGSTRAAAAQASDARGFIMINGGIQATSADFSDTITFSHPLFGPETGDFEMRCRGNGDRLFDVSGGIRIWRRLAVGAGVSQFAHTDDAGITGRIPHPFRFDRLRPISGTDTGLARKETAVHVQALWVIPAGRAVIALFGGPTFFTVTQDLVTRRDVQPDIPVHRGDIRRDTSPGRSRARRSADTPGPTSPSTSPIGLGLAAWLDSAAARSTWRQAGTPLPLMSAASRRLGGYASASDTRGPKPQMNHGSWVLVTISLLCGAVACEEEPDSPTAPTPNPPAVMWRGLNHPASGSTPGSSRSRRGWCCGSCGGAPAVLSIFSARRRSVMCERTCG